jgi:hypothetical protein
MNSKFIIGSVVYGAAGIGCKVLAVEGDTLTVETPKGLRTIHFSKVVNVENPDTDVMRVSTDPPTTITQLKLGDRVRFVGNFRDWGIEYGAILTVVEDCDEWIKTRTAGRKPISVLRSDLECLGVNNLPIA